jgi:hypothetical protein
VCAARHERVLLLFSVCSAKTSCAKY